MRKLQGGDILERRTFRRSRPANDEGSHSAPSENTSTSPVLRQDPGATLTDAAPSTAPSSAPAVASIIDIAPTSALPPAIIPLAETTPSRAFDNNITEFTNQTLMQILTSAPTPESRLTNETAAALEFLAHGHRNVLNRFSGREPVAQSTPRLSTSRNENEVQWDKFFEPEDARMLLALHQVHLTWMHNVVHLPTFRQELESNLMQLECDYSWLALYYALLSHTVYHIGGDYLAVLPQPIHADIRTSRLLFDKSIEILFKSGFMDEHKLTSVQAVCLLLQVAHNFDKSDLICVLISSAIRISQCLGLHRLGSNQTATQIGKDDILSIIEREIRRRVWWFLIHPAQFNTPMPANSFDDEARMVQNGVIVSQPADICTSSSWTNCLNQLSVLIWKHQDRMFRVGYPGEDPDKTLKLYDQTLWADREIKELYSSWPLALRETDNVQNGQLLLDSFPVGLMSGTVLVCTAHKLSCISIAERSIEEIQRWPDTLESSINRRMWTTLTHVVSCCITLVFALLFKSQNSLTYDSARIRRYIEFGRKFINQEEHVSSIARRGAKLLTALMNLEGCSNYSLDLEADIGDIIRRVATADDEDLEISASEAHQIVFPGNQDLWEDFMRDGWAGGAY